MIYNLLLVAHALLAVTPNKETLTRETQSPPPPLVKGSSTASYMLIPLKDRAVDLQQAFDLLKKEKATGKVYFQLSDGTSISNVIDFTLMPNSSLILFRFNTNNQGIKLQ